MTAKKIDLGKMVQGRKPGEWLVFSVAASRVVGTGKSEREALAHARANRRPIKDPILLRVLDPSETSK